MSRPRTASLFLLILLPFILPSCATRRAPSHVIPAAPPKAVAVTPEADKVRERIADADKTAALVTASAKDALLSATAARQEAERLKDRKAAGEAELTRLWQDLRTVEARHVSLEKETTRLTASLTDARAAAATLQRHAAAKDAEADHLRAQHAHLTATVADHATQLAAATKATTDQRARAERLRGEIRIYRIALAIIGILLIGWIAGKLLLSR